MDNKIFDQIITEIGNGNFNVAIQHCNDILTDYPENRSVYEIRSGCYYALGNYESAISDLTTSIDKYKNNGESNDEIINLFVKRGKIYLEKGDWLNASEDFKKILDFNQNLPEVQNNLGICYRRMDNYDAALYHSTQAIKLNHDYAEAYNNRANINISLGKYHEAIVDYSRSIELNPLNANVYFNRGSIYYDILKNKVNAIQDFLKAVVINPNFKSEILNQYPELSQAFENTSEESKKEDLHKQDSVTEEKVITEAVDMPDEKKADKQEEAVTQEKVLPEAIEVPIDKAEVKQEVTMPEEESAVEPDNTDIGFSIDDFSSLFQEKTADTPQGLTEDQPLKPLKPIQESAKDDDIVIPDLDLKSMFTNLNESEETIHTEEEPMLNDKPVITDAIKSLHDEIQTNGEKVKEDSGIMGGVKFEGMTDFEDKDKVFDGEPAGIRQSETVEEKKSFLKSPLFFIILILIIGIVILLSVVKFFDTQENQISNAPTDRKADSTIVKKTDSVKADTKDTVTQKEPEEKEAKETKKEEVKTEEPVKQNTELTSKNLGFISDKKQFVLFSEPDGYYVQMGSYKEKTKADEKLKLLEKNNIKGKVTEADLKEKGIFYRVRAGVFKTPEEAKEKTIKLE